MFERFTDRARKTVALAQEIASEAGAKEITPRHLLAGLWREAEGVAGIVLREQDIDCRVERVSDQRTRGHLPFTNSAKQTLELALREALQLGHNYIGTEHILLALCRLDAGWFNPTAMRRAVVKKLASYGDAATARDPLRLAAISLRRAIDQFLAALDADARGAA